MVGAFEVVGDVVGCRVVGLFDGDNVGLGVGTLDGAMVGLFESQDGVDVGQSETDGCSLGWVLGAALIDDDSDDNNVGKPVLDCASLGIELG